MEKDVHIIFLLVNLKKFRNEHFKIYLKFLGRDASVAFITGDFETYTDKSDDILQLEPSELLSLYNWKKFYDKEYIYKGKLIGR